MSTRATSAEVGDPNTFTLAISLTRSVELELELEERRQVCVCVDWIALGRAYIVAKAGSTKCLASQEVNLKIENESKGKEKRGKEQSV